MAEKKEKPFEKQLEELEEIVESLDSGDISLEDMLKKYEEGMKLAKNCRNFLEKAEQKIIEISEI